MDNYHHTDSKWTTIIFLTVNVKTIIFLTVNVKTIIIQTVNGQLSSYRQ